jgi:chitinase
MKKVLIFIFLAGCFIQAQAQYQVNTPRKWDKYPTEAQERGFGPYVSQQVQMDDDPALEDVILFSAHNGHYPYFDLFKNYYVIIDHYTKEIEYKSDIVISTERDLVLEDRNNDGIHELYRRYFQDGKFTVDEYGNNLKTIWVYDCIEWKDEKDITTKELSR